MSDELREWVRNKVAARAGCKTPCRMSVLDCACLNTTDAAIALVRDATLEEAAKVAEPKRKACECVELLQDGTWYCDCGCTNSGDFANAMAWCNDANIAAAIRALKGKPND